jgi:hypothetical protein
MKATAQSTVEAYCSLQFPLNFVCIDVALIVYFNDLIYSFKNFFLRVVPSVHFTARQSFVRVLRFITLNAVCEKNAFVLVHQNIDNLIQFLTRSEK